MNMLQRKLANIPPSWRAIVFLWREELSFKVLTICAVLIIALSFLVHISVTEFLLVVLTIGAVLSIEALNTALEELCDHITLDEHPQIGKVKDIASGASLLMLIAALIVGLTIFIPHLTNL